MGTYRSLLFFVHELFWDISRFVLAKVCTVDLFNSGHIGLNGKDPSLVAPRRFYEASEGLAIQDAASSESEIAPEDPS
jgi:hypothetical protein